MSACSAEWDVAWAEGEESAMTCHASSVATPQWEGSSQTCATFAGHPWRPLAQLGTRVRGRRGLRGARVNQVDWLATKLIASGRTGLAARPRVGAVGTRVAASAG